MGRCIKRTVRRVADFARLENVHTDSFNVIFDPYMDNTSA